MAENEKAVPLAISLPESLIAEIDTVAAEVKDSRSATMRRAIREGLPIVKLGGKTDTIALDSELSADVDTASEEIGLSRIKILLESIRTGFQAFVARKLSEKMSLAELKTPEDREMILRAVEQSYRLYDDPMAIECRSLIHERGEAVNRLMDILRHVPEAQKRFDLVNRLAELRHQAPYLSGPAWMSGLSNEEIEWQLEMVRKFGADAAKWPEDLKKAHNDAQDAKNKPRYELMQRLAAIRSAAGLPVGMVSGLSVEELKRQIEFSEKYGANPASWPENLKKTHNDAEDAKKKRRKLPP